MHDPLLKYKIAITLIPKIGSINAKKLIAYVGSIEGVFKETKKALKKIPGIGEGLATNITSQKVMARAEQEIEFTEKHDIKTLFYLDKNYPKRLKQCEDAPVLFYYKGETDFNAPKILSIIGTRNSTSNGIDNCNKLIEDLKANGHNPLIISGLAYGIDICSHKAALKNNLETVAVLGHGLHTIYPANHRNTAVEITKNGALLTEFLSNSKIERSNFVKRNRIIAGLSDATIVVESASSGGALITANIANSYNRDVFAFPGRTTDEYSAGCNFLIKTNKAALISSAKDIEYILQWDTKKQPIQIEMFNNLTDSEQLIVDVLKNEEKVNIDNISYKTELPINQVVSLLFNLEFSGVVKSMPGNMYTIKKFY